MLKLVAKEHKRLKVTLKYVRYSIYIYKNGLRLRWSAFYSIVIIFVFTYAQFNLGAWSSIKPGTWKIPDHSETSMNIPEHRIIMIIMRKIRKNKFSKTEKISNLEAAKLKLHKCYHFMILL